MQSVFGQDQSAGGPAPAQDRAALLRWEARQTLKLALPLVVAQLAFIALGATDTLMMGWLGKDQLAAGALGNNIFFPLYLLGMGIVIAVAPMVAQELGAGHVRAVRRTVRQGFWVAALVGILASIVLWHGEAILLLFGQRAENAALAGSYLRAALWGFTFSLGFVVLRAFLTAHARPRAVVVIGLVAVAVNALGNYVLMFGKFGFPALGLVGAGISTSIVAVVMFFGLLAFVLLDPHFRDYALLLRLWRPDWARFREILRLGTPIGLSILAESGMFAGAGIMMGWISNASLAAHAIAVQCAAVAFMVPLGFSQAATVRVGFAAGAGRIAAVGRAGWVAVAMGGAFALLSAAAFLLLPVPLVDLFLDLDQVENRRVLGLAVGFLGVAALFQLMDGAQVIAAGGLRGLKDTRTPMLICVAGYWPIGMLSAYLLAFPLGLGGVGIWYGLAIGLTVVAAALLWRFYRRDRLTLTPRPLSAEAL